MTNRRSYTQAQFNFKFSWVYTFQLLTVALIVGVKSNSTAFGLATLLGLGALSVVPITAALIGLGFAIFWALFGYQLAADMSAGFPTMLLSGVVMFIVGLGFNVSGLTFLNDLSRPVR